LAKLCRPAALAKNVTVRMTSVLLALAPAFGRFVFVLCAHVVHGWLKLVRIANTVQENQAGIRPSEAAEIPLGLCASGENGHQQESGEDGWNLFHGQPTGAIA